MESHEVLRKAFKKVGCKNVATELRLSPSLIHQWARGRNGKSAAANPLDRVQAVVRFTGDTQPLEWLCEQAGGRFVPQSELPSFLHGCWLQFKTEMERLMQAATARQAVEGSQRPPESCCCRHQPVEFAVRMPRLCLKLLP